MDILGFYSVAHLAVPVQSRNPALYQQLQQTDMGDISVPYTQ
jgi:hypothetical protein